MKVHNVSLIADNHSLYLCYTFLLIFSTCVCLYLLDVSFNVDSISPECSGWDEHFDENESPTPKRKRRSSIYSLSYHSPRILILRNTLYKSWKLNIVAEPYGTTKRSRWSEEEKNAVLGAFQHEMSSGRLPSSSQIKKLITAETCFQNRNPA